MRRTGIETLLNIHQPHPPVEMNHGLRCNGKQEEALNNIDKNSKEADVDRLACMVRNRFIIRSGMDLLQNGHQASHPDGASNEEGKKTRQRKATNM